MAVIEWSKLQWDHEKDAAFAEAMGLPVEEETGVLYLNDGRTKFGYSDPEYVHDKVKGINASGGRAEVITRKVSTDHLIHSAETMLEFALEHHVTLTPAEGHRWKAAMCNYHGFDRDKEWVGAKHWQEAKEANEAIMKAVLVGHGHTLV